jgi:site-specific recombinase XerC
VGLVVQRVDLPGGEVSWTVLAADYAVVEPVDRFLAHLSSVDRSPTTVRSYAFDLRDLFNFLAQIDVVWDAVRLEDLGRFVAWLRQSPAERAGTVTRPPRRGV